MPWGAPTGFLKGQSESGRSCGCAYPLCQGPCRSAPRTQTGNSSGSSRGRDSNGSHFFGLKPTGSAATAPHTSRAARDDRDTESTRATSSRGSRNSSTLQRNTSSHSVRT